MDLGACVIAEETWRLLSCVGCGVQLRVCPTCDRGQRFCSPGCGAVHRRRGQREAGRVYQTTKRGARLHAARMQRYRDRIRALDGKFLAPIGDATARARIAS